MNMRLSLFAIVCVSLFAAFLQAADPVADKTAPPKLTAEKTDKGVTIKIDDKFFTEYVFNSLSRPIVYPIMGPTDKKMTRDYPMVQRVAGETTDHPHHRSLWFAHGDVNGIDFWTEGNGKGKVEHKELVRAEGGSEAVVVTRNEWVGPTGTAVMADERVLTFGLSGESRWIDFAVTMKATHGQVKFGDTKEGTFGVRVPDTMRLEAKKGGKIVNSEGQMDDDTWAKQAKWVDYFGPVENETLGVAIFNHASSFRYPTFWHVRGYGMFAVNPFTNRDFNTTKQGAYTLPANESLMLRYRVVFHKGSDKDAHIADLFADYLKVPALKGEADASKKDGATKSP